MNDGLKKLIGDFVVLKKFITVYFPTILLLAGFFTAEIGFFHISYLWGIFSVSGGFILTACLIEYGRSTRR
jgi:hypothetical protein